MNHNQRNLLIYIFSSLLGAYSCSSSNNKSSKVITAKNPPHNPEIEQPEAIPKAIDKGVDNTGDIAGGNGALWETGCLASKDGAFLQHSFTTKGATLIQSKTFYGDDQCGQIQYEISESLELISLIRFNSKGDGFHYMDAKVTSLFLRPIAAGQAELFNISKYCGQTDCQEVHYDSTR